jgi:hypothetical protein
MPTSAVSDDALSLAAQACAENTKTVVVAKSTAKNEPKQVVKLNLELTDFNSSIA